MATVTVGISHGADAEALRSLALALLTTADHLEHVDLRTVDGVDALGWTGQDARTFRATWDQTHAVTLHLTAALMRRGAAHLLDEAADQVEASGLGGPLPAAGPVGPAPTGADASWWAELRDGVHAWVDEMAEVYGPTIGALGTVSTLVGLAELDGVRRRAGQVMDALGASGPLGGVLDASIGTGTGRVLGAIDVVGTAHDLHDAWHGYQEGDAWRAVDGGVSGGLGIAGMASSHPGVALAGISWGVGSAVGDELRESMEGTAFGDRFTERMDAVFDVAGPAGMLVTPGALIVTAAEAVGETVAETVLDLTDGGDPLLGGAGGEETRGGGGR